jgi:hypothetical protein
MPDASALPSASTAARPASYLTTANFDLLNLACLPVHEAFDTPPYLVGSALERARFRDVDLRTILPDDEWDALFADKPRLWSLCCLSVSHYLTDLTGLPVDYQVQRRTEANEKFGGRMRNPMGMRARLFAGGGDATPDVTNG